MLHAALTALLFLQTASGSPNIAPSSPAAPGAGTSITNSPSMNPGLPSSEEPASAEAPPPPGAPTPAPTRTPAPTPAGRRGSPLAPAPAKASADQLLVVNKTDDSLSILDAASGKLRTTVAVEPGPHEVETLANHMAAVSSYGRKDAPGRYVSIIDLASGKVVSKIDIGEGSKPHGLKALRDGRLLVTAEGRKELVAVDPREGKVLARYPTGRDLSHLVTASPDGRRAFVTSLTPGSLTVIDLSTGKVVKDIPTGKGAEGLDVTPDGREVWIANREANTITVVDVATLAPVFTIRASEFPIRVKIAPDGRTAIATFSGTGDVRVFDTATRVEKSRVSIGRDAVEGSETRVFQKRFGSGPVPVGLLIAPDGKRAFVSAGHADVVAVIDLERMRVDDAWTAGREPDGLAMSVGAAPAPTPAAAPAVKKPTIVHPR
jgi:YVTN family beta-propeller protein